MNQVIRINEQLIPKSILRVFTYIGRISYGVYVWHVLIIRINPGAGLLSFLSIDLSRGMEFYFNRILNLVMTVLLTEISIKFFENPIRTRGRRRMKPQGKETDLRDISLQQKRKLFIRKSLKGEKLI